MNILEGPVLRKLLRLQDSLKVLQEGNRHKKPLDLDSFDFDSDGNLILSKSAELGEAVEGLSVKVYENVPKNQLDNLKSCLHHNEAGNRKKDSSPTPPVHEVCVH
ncbi:unnamed protein product [Darwinula stevensoni]|uniref:Uncharacterized protein n=1 Tax=Darwinula stevensoni TaxID=69355 RepID=A0A7R8X592_9CRUS|nr:unnamed protein product [Darwinula stevensoni]CAG0886881.1 unnamed protein product [Darwinula stevensoni]